MHANAHAPRLAERPLPLQKNMEPSNSIALPAGWFGPLYLSCQLDGLQWNELEESILGASPV